MSLYIYEDSRYPSGFGITTNKSLRIANAPADAEVGDSPYLVYSEGEFSIDSINKQQDKAAQAAASLANQYKEDRRAAYPSIGDQLDALYKKLELNDDTDWNDIAAQIANVKATYPKP